VVPVWAIAPEKVSVRVVGVGDVVVDVVALGDAHAAAKTAAAITPTHDRTLRIMARAQTRISPPCTVAADAPR
jgi:hypothetical protein